MDDLAGIEDRLELKRKTVIATKNRYAGLLTIPFKVM